MEKGFKRVLSLSLAAVLMAVIAGCGGGGAAPSGNTAPAQPAGQPAAQPAPAAGPAIKIGLIGPLSGPNAYTGQAIEKGVKVAVAEANAAGGLPGNGQIQLLSSDDAGAPAQAVSLAQKYINQDKVAALLGPFTSATTAAVKDIANQAKIPMASTGAAADNITEKDVDWYFRPHMYNALQSSQFAQYVVQTLGMKKLAIIYENSDWGKGLDTSMGQLVKQMGASIVAEENYNTGTTDFNASLTKIKAAKPDGILAICLITEATIVARQAADLGIKGDQIVGLGGWDQDKLAELAGPAANGIKFMMWYAPEIPGVPAAKDFAAAYGKMFPGEVPDSFAAQGYAAAKSMFLAIKNAGSTDGTKIRDALIKTSFDSPIGHIAFDDHHNATASVFMAQWKNGKKVLLDKQPGSK